MTVENLTDNGDMSFSLKRDDLSSLCAELLERFKQLIRKSIEAAGLQAEQLSGVEVLGGGIRMQV